MIVQQEVMVESKEKCKREEKTLSATIEKGMPDGEDIVFKYESEQKPGQVPPYLPCISPVSPQFEVRFRPSTELNTANQLGRLVVQLPPGLSSGGGAKKAGDP